MMEVKCTAGSNIKLAHNKKWMPQEIVKFLIQENAHKMICPAANVLAINSPTLIKEPMNSQIKV